MYKIRYSGSKGIYYVELFGEIKHQQIIKYLTSITESQVDCTEIIIISDFRKATIGEENVDPIEDIGRYVNSKMKTVFDFIKWAVLSESPLPTTGTLILYDLIKDNQLDMQPFSTLEALLRWTQLGREDLEGMSLLEANEE